MDFTGMILDIFLLSMSILMIFLMKILWEREKEDRIDREKKIENIYNEIMGKNEKWGGKWKIK